MPEFWRCGTYTYRGNPGLTSSQCSDYGQKYITLNSVVLNAQSGCGSGVEPASCYQKDCGLIPLDCTSTLLNPKMLLMCWLAPCMAATAISVWITASRFGFISASFLICCKMHESSQPSCQDNHHDVHICVCHTYFIDSHAKCVLPFSHCMFMTWVKTKRAAEPVTMVKDCASTLTCCVTPLDIFEESSGPLPVVFIMDIYCLQNNIGNTYLGN